VCVIFMIEKGRMKDGGRGRHRYYFAHPPFFTRPSIRKDREERGGESDSDEGEGGDC
jgi:hypothetical protein